ncbi:MAG: hypothetical protein ACRDL5_03530 [Solirubrobacteraceae bacterium]
MWRRAAGTIAVPIAVLAASGVAAAATTGTSIVDVTLSGALTIAWSGNPVRGCAAVGQCGVSGTLQVVPDPTEVIPVASLSQPAI